MIAAFYNKTREWLATEDRLVLMVVIANEGSSPGRKGFKMLVSKNEMFGTIGGGIMEHKLVEYARTLLSKPQFTPFVKHQIHDKLATKDQSGMICSGRQTIAFYDLDSAFVSTIDAILADANAKVTYSNFGINTPKTANAEWFFGESNAVIPKAYIIGGGHVGLALSEVLSLLDFEIHVLDHRENLNTMQANQFAATKQTINFETIEQHLPEANDSYVIIMSFGYRTDDIIIRRLLGRNFKYIGLLGSKEKIATLFKNLLADGYHQTDIDKVFAPIGLDIKSETAHEIAISVAAQLIKIKNQT